MSKVLIEVLVIILIVGSYLMLYPMVRVSAIADQRIAERQDRNTDLEQRISQRDETIQEQGQAIIAKNSIIEKYKSAEEKAADEHRHERTVLQEETVEKQSENENKQNYDSQAVGQTQGAMPQQAATIPTGQFRFMQMQVEFRFIAL